MRKRPSGSKLLAIAQATEGELAANPDDPQARYKQAMIRNARAIAERQADAGDTFDEEQDALQALLGHGGNLEDLNRELAKAIRSGTPPAGTHAHLTTVNRQDLAESNPRYLERLNNA